MPSDGAEELLKALHKWYIRRRVCQLQQCNGRLSSKEIEGEGSSSNIYTRVSLFMTLGNGITNIVPNQHVLLNLVRQNGVNIFPFLCPCCSLSRSAVQRRGRTVDGWMMDFEKVC